MATTTTRNTQTVATIVELLSGMRVSPDALEWTNDIPVANQLMSNIAQQLCTDGQGVDRATVLPALRNISLEHKELTILRDLDSPNPSNSLSELTGYRLPSELQRQADYLRSEIQILEDETTLLNNRSRQIKKASHHMEQTIKSLQDTLAHVQSTNTNTMNHLDELSLQMDDTIASATDSGCSLLSTLTPGYTFFDEQYTAHLAVLAQSYSDFNSTFTQHLDFLDSTSELEREDAELGAEELEILFQRYSPDVKWEDLPESVRDGMLHETYVREIGDLCDRMEGINVSGEKSWDGVHDIIRWAEGQVPDEAYRGQIVPDVHAEVEHAWARDQQSYLNARVGLLDNALSTMQDSLMAPLDEIFSALSLEERLIREAEVMCGVLGEEVEVVMDTPEQVETVSGEACSPPSEDRLDEELKKVLMDNAHLRDASAPPLVILSNEDITQEITRLAERKQQVARQELELSAKDGELFKTLDNLNASHSPFLEAIYANSPLNTSLPFLLPRKHTELMDDTRMVAEKLSAETERLTKEVETVIEGKKAQKKLGSFVDRWTAIEA